MSEQVKTNRRNTSKVQTDQKEARGNKKLKNTKERIRATEDRAGHL